jgi:hypothetical protein
LPGGNKRSGYGSKHPYSEPNVYEFNQTALSFYQRLGYEALSRKMSKALNRG